MAKLVYKWKVGGGEGGWGDPMKEMGPPHYRLVATSQKENLSVIIAKVETLKVEQNRINLPVIVLSGLWGWRG